MGTTTLSPVKGEGKAGEERKEQLKQLKKNLKLIDEYYNHLTDGGGYVDRTDMEVFLATRWAFGEDEEIAKIEQRNRSLMRRDPVTCTTIVDLKNDFKKEGRHSRLFHKRPKSKGFSKYPPPIPDSVW